MTERINVRWEGQLKSPIKAKLFGDLDRLQVFFAGDSTINFRILIGPELRPVLFHNIDVGVDRDSFSDELKNFFGRRNPIGHDEVANEEAPLRNPIGIHE